MEIEDQKRISILSFDTARLADVAKFVNQYPNIDVQFELVDSDIVEAGDVVTVIVSLEREGEEDEVLGPVIAPFYPNKKDEGWWLVVGDTTDNHCWQSNEHHLESRLRSSWSSMLQIR